MRLILFLSLLGFSLVACQSGKDSKLQSTLTEDDFIGVYDLEPNRSSYEVGDKVSHATYQIHRADYKYIFEYEYTDVTGNIQNTNEIVKEGKTIGSDSYTILKVQDGTKLFTDTYNTNGEFEEGIMRELFVENEEIVLVITEKRKLTNGSDYYINKQTFVKR